MKTNLDFLDKIAAEDVAGLKNAATSYGDSWKKRGGVGAFMMLARKWDRIENRINPGPGYQPGDGRKLVPWDIFAAIEQDTRSEGVIDDIRDLRRYLMLVESEMRVREAESALSLHRDNKE